MKIQLYIEGMSEESIRERKKAKFELVVKKGTQTVGKMMTMVGETLGL